MLNQFQSQIFTYETLVVLIICNTIILHCPHITSPNSRRFTDNDTSGIETNALKQRFTVGPLSTCTKSSMIKLLFKIINLKILKYES